MGVALNFSRKSSTMGKLWVSWEPLIDSPPKEQQLSSPIPNRSSSSSKFRRRVQFGISLCFATLIFALVVFFFLCSIESSNRGGPNPPQSGPVSSVVSTPVPDDSALQGMGKMFRRGSRSMNELVVAHIAEDLAPQELRLFLRSFHRSGISARADLVLIFPGDPRSSQLASIVDEETQFFNRLLRLSACLPSNDSLIEIQVRVSEPDQLGPRCGEGAGVQLASNSSISRLNLEPFIRAEEESRARAEAKLLKAKMNTNWTIPRLQRRQLAAGAIMGFDINELDPMDTLSGFLDRPSIQLRRWLCYQLLLGIAKQQQQSHRYYQVLIAQVRGVFLLSDSLLAMSRKKKDQRSLFLFAEDRSWLDDSPDKRRRRGLMEEVYGKAVSDSGDASTWRLASGAVVAGGARSVRRLADAVATEIARVAMLRHRKPFADQAALNYVLRRNARLNDGREMVYLSADAGHPASAARYADVAIAGDVDSRSRVAAAVAADLCGSPRELAVYSDCSATRSE